MLRNKEALIAEIFATIPTSEILSRARSLRDSSDWKAWSKDGGEDVSVTDFAIQALVLDHFQCSRLNGKYSVLAEEGAQQDSESGSSIYTLVIDPLDGTAQYIAGEPQWGCMVGLCDVNGNIIFSWNMCSDGFVYRSNSYIPNSGRNPSVSGARLRLDLFDYDAGLLEDLDLPFEYETVKNESAVYSGRMLFEGTSDALLWIASNKGKRTYPPYDLVFLGALSDMGWLTRVAWRDDEVQLVAVARSSSVLDQLFETGLRRLPDGAGDLEVTDKRITRPKRGYAQ